MDVDEPIPSREFQSPGHFDDEDLYQCYVLKQMIRSFMESLTASSKLTLL